MRNKLLPMLALTLIICMTSCDLFKTYTIRVNNLTDSDIHGIYYRAKGGTDWKNTKAKKEQSITSISLFEPLREQDYAFFTVPGIGEYEVKAADINGTLGPFEGDNNIINAEVLNDDMGEDSTIELSISTTESTHGYN